MEIKLTEEQAKELQGSVDSLIQKIKKDSAKNRGIWLCQIEISEDLKAEKLKNFHCLHGETAIRMKALLRGEDVRDVAEKARDKLKRILPELHPDYHPVIDCLSPDFAITLCKKFDHLEALLEEREHSLEALIDESDGVAGLHRNGDIAEWEWLKENGWLRF